MYNVLTISSKINRGGAGKIAFDIHQNLSNGTFLYGYDKRGLKNKQYKSITKGSLLVGPFINFLTHNIIGKDILGNSLCKIDKFIRKADIIHLHIIHSYAFNYVQLFNLFIKYNKAVVVTAHDSWFYTGRCAIRHQCLKWQSMCIKCDHLDYYPPSIIDIAHDEFIKKTSLIRKIENLTFVSPSNWLLSDIKKVYPKKKCLLIPNGINVDLYRNKEFIVDKRIIHISIIINDFKDKDKFNSNLLNAILEEKNIHVHFIGQNCHITSPNSTRHGYITTEDIIEILFSSDILLFFSKVDNYPTVLIEALCSGVHVACVNSKGAFEIVSQFDYTEIKSDFISKLRDSSFVERIKSKKLKKYQQDIALEKFSGKIMINEYSRLYDNVLY